MAELCASGDLASGTALSTLTGRGTRATEFIVYALRLPRMLCAVPAVMLVGALSLVVGGWVAHLAWLLFRDGGKGR